MFSTVNGDEYRYDFTTSKFRIAFEFLKRSDLKELPVGTIELGEDVRALVQSYETKDEKDAFFESHELFFDIQFVAEGREYCGICSRSGLAVRTPYNEDNDITFYEDPPLSGKVLMSEGSFILLSPEDVHKPCLTAGEKCKVKKIVIKVPV